MAFGIENAGTVAIQKIDSETLPHVAAIINDTLQQVSVLLTGAVTAIDGERVAAFDALAPVIKPLLDESAAWRSEIAAWRELVENRGFSLGGMPLLANPRKEQV